MEYEDRARMGFFDKAKNFMGGHGVKVRHTIIERQDPTAATLPLTDSVVKGKFEVTADKPCTVLSMKAEVYLEAKHSDGREEIIALGEDVFPAPHVHRQDDMVKYPYELAAGASVEDFFIISMDTTIPDALAKRHLSADKVKLVIKTTVDVKGSPFDPEAKNELRILA